MTASRMIIRTCSVLSIANSGAPFDSTCSARTSSPDDIRYQRIIRFTKFRDATRAAAFPGCPRNLVLSSGPIAARTSRRSFIFAPQPTVTLSRGLLGIKAFFCYEDTPNCGTSATERNGVGRGASWALRPSLRFLRRPPARPRHHGWGRRPAPEHPQRPPRPFRRTVRPPGGSGAPAGRSGAPPEARKAPKSKIGLPRPLLKWEAWGARCRFRPLETAGTASNMHVMA